MLELGYHSLGQEWKRLAKKSRANRGIGAWLSDGLNTAPSLILSHSRLLIFRLLLYEREISSYLVLLFCSSL